MVDLFEDAAEAPDEQQLSINQSYAERYQHNKRRVHLEQLQQKYGEEEGDSDESDSEDVTEDEDGEQPRRERRPRRRRMRSAESSEEE